MRFTNSAWRVTSASVSLPALSGRALYAPAALTAPPRVASDDPETDIVAIESLAPDDDIVDIADLAPDDTVVSIESLAPDQPGIPDAAPGEPSRLERAFTRRAALRAERGDGAATLEGLIGEAIVEIDTLLFRGDGAIRRVDELRPQVAAMLADSATSLADLRPVLDELLDLLPLTRDAA